MNASTRHNNVKNGTDKNRSGQKRLKPLLPALVAMSVAAPASALEIGDVQIDSTLGHPLQASVAYALNPHEELYDFCISLSPGGMNAAIPALTKAKITLTNNKILLSGTIPIKEPMLAMRLTVDCPYSAHLIRDYTLMINPSVPVPLDAQPATASALQPLQAVQPVQRPAPATVVVPEQSGRVPVSRRGDDSPLNMGSQYTVQIGDSASAIAGRVVDNSAGLWPTINAIFAANPDAFHEGNVDHLKAGSVVTIPVMSGAAVEPSVDTQAPANDYQQYEYGDTQSADTYQGYTPDSVADPIENIQQPAPEADAVVEEAKPATVAKSPDFQDDTAYLESGEMTPENTTVEETPVDKVAEAQPGDLFVGSDIPEDASFESDAGDDPVRLDANASSERDIPMVQSSNSSGSGNDVWTWLMYGGGAALALIAGFFMFGRKSKGGSGGDSVARMQPSMEEDDSLEQTQSSTIVSDVDFQFDDALIPGETDIELDADLGAGTGLQDSDDMDVAQDFGFSATSTADMPLDLEIPEHDESDEPTRSTDIIPPQHGEDENILDSEIPPGDDDDSQYDLSMIVDATKQQIHDSDHTTKDLNAVAVDADLPADASEYTLNNEVDFEILEQDYEEEYTQTLALNDEIAKAAEDLASRMDSDDGANADVFTDATIEMPQTDDDVSLDQLTAQLPVAPELEATSELTANMPAGAENDDIGDSDDTSINEALTIDMSEDVTVEMPANDDATVEMDVESGKVDTKKTAGDS